MIFLKKLKSTESYIFLLILLSLYPQLDVKSQSLTTLDLLEAYILLENNYPNLRKAQIWDEVHQLELNRLDIMRKPTISWKADSRLQSTSTQLKPGGEVMLPFEIDVPLFSLKSYLEGQYILYDGGVNEASKAIKKADFEVQKQYLEVEKFTLRRQVNSLVLNIMSLRESTALIAISIDDVTLKKDLIQALMEEGMVLESELTKLEVTQIKLLSKQQDLELTVEGLLESLSYLIGIKLDKQVEFKLPENISDKGGLPINRPELNLFKLQQKQILSRNALIESESKPKLSAFAQAGIGYPNPLNILDNGIAPYGMLGVQFSWKIVDWNKTKTDQSILQLRREEIDFQRQTFEFNLNSKDSNFSAAVKRKKARIATLQTIAKLEHEILEQYSAQLEEGIITTSEYTTQLNKELKARQDLVINEMALLKTKVEFWNDKGAF